MSLTVRQQDILERIGDVEVRFKRTGQLGYRLRGNDVTTTITSLIVKNFIARTDVGRGVFLTQKGRKALGVFAT